MTKKKIDWKKISLRRAAGLGLIAAGGFVLFSPFFFGEWIISSFGIVFVAAGVYLLYDIIRSEERTTEFVSYIAGLVAILVGGVLFFSPETVLSGITVAVSLFLLVDGAAKIWGALRGAGKGRIWETLNGAISILLGLLAWIILSADLGIFALGIVLGVWLSMQGWRLLFISATEIAGEKEEEDLLQHPDRRLRLKPGEDIKKLNESLRENERDIARQDIYWILTVIGILFASHFFRTKVTWSILGAISPFAAILGDILLSIIIGAFLVLPVRLLWRFLTRPIERAAWLRFRDLKEKNEGLAPGEKVLRYWVEGRMRFSYELRTVRESLYYAFWRLVRFGLPVVAVFVAISAIWGFSWYYNSENWASIVFQRLTQSRVDDWRQRAAEAVEASALRKGAAKEDVFAIDPGGVTDAGDFSFVVIGDTGEGDQSQMILKDRLIEAGNREDVKFLILSSDVIYPDGRMEDYETNFYLPFKGFKKPIYAIPGNHDWFDAGEGYIANFYERESASISLKEGFAKDLLMNDEISELRYGSILEEADRLREYYGIDNGLQRSPFFELHSEGFSLITLDTGILREIDPKQEAWLGDALKRAGDNFKFVILGHPFYVAGRDSSEGDERFRRIHEKLRGAGVDVVMAGDTHDFEYYGEEYEFDARPKRMHHFVNGGGGAYLSIGTALGFPEDPVSDDYVFYPRADRLESKIRSEAPLFARPFVWWMDMLNGWPFDQEFLSGAFNFNNSPFFQSFMVVNVERSQARVRIELIGDRGPVLWGDVQSSGIARPTGAGDNDPVEFVIEIDPGKTAEEVEEEPVPEE